MEAAETWADVFGTMELSSKEETLKGSAVTPPTLGADSRTIRRSQPILITSNRMKGDESFSSSVPSIPNPFPELCSPSKSPVLISSPPQRSPPSQSADKRLVRFYGQYSCFTSIWISPQDTAREVCEMLTKSPRHSDQENWALLECYPTLGLERCLEDHEVVLKVRDTWPQTYDTRLIFSKNYAKYEFFRKPTLFFPESMISDCTGVHIEKTSSELITHLLESGTCPEIQGFLYMKEPNRKSWKKVYFFLRRSGLYSSSRGSSKDPRYLRYVADLASTNVYRVVNSQKLYRAPSEFTFCIKPCRNPISVQNLKFLCAENEQTRTCWISAFRLFKYGNQLQLNYETYKSALSNLEDSNLTNGRAKSEDSLVAMDFSGKAGGRVIQNETEAQNAEKEEGQAWRKKEALRCRLPNMNSAVGPSSIHSTQLWFHGGMSRKEAERLIEKQGLVDGMFLLRDSQVHEQCFVLSLCYKLKVKHYLVSPHEEGGRKYFTIDGRETLFIDLLQLVEFHQINKGILPVCLKHPCVCVAP